MKSNQNTKTVVLALSLMFIGFISLTAMSNGLEQNVPVQAAQIEMSKSTKNFYLKCGDGKSKDKKAKSCKNKCSNAKCGGEKAKSCKHKNGDDKDGGSKSKDDKKTKESKCGSGKCGNGKCGKA